MNQLPSSFTDFEQDQGRPSYGHFMANSDGKDFSFMFRGSSCQGDFFGGIEELHDLNNFAMSNVIVEILQQSQWFFTMAVYSEACAKAYIQALQS